MNIHEHQAKDLLKTTELMYQWYSNFIWGRNYQKIKELKSKKFVVKAQIHAGGRGKAGGVKLVTDPNKLEKERQICLEKS